MKLLIDCHDQPADATPYQELRSNDVVNDEVRVTLAEGQLETAIDKGLAQKKPLSWIHPYSYFFRLVYGRMAERRHGNVPWNCW